MRIARVHHHGAEVGGIAHDIPGLLQAYALFLAQFVVERRIFCELGGKIRLDNRHIQVKAEGSYLCRDLGSVAEQDDIGHIAPQEHIRGAQDALFRAFGQHNAHLFRGCPLKQVVFEHLGGNFAAVHIDDARFNLPRIDTGLKMPEGRIDFARIVRVYLAVEISQHLRCLEGVVLYGKNGNGHAGPAFYQAVDVHGKLKTAREHDAGNIRVGAGKA